MPTADPSEVLTRAAPPPTTTIRYGELPDHVADLWLPRPSSSRPRRSALVVVIHGGFWRAGFDRTHIRPMAQCACRTRASRSPRSSIAAPGCRAAAGRAPCDDVRQRGRRSCPICLPHEPVGAVGPLCSPGTAPAATSRSGPARRSPQPGLAGVVSLAGVCDLVRADELGLGAQGDDGAVARIPRRRHATGPRPVRRRRPDPAAAARRAGRPGPRRARHRRTDRAQPAGTPPTRGLDRAPTSSWSSCPASSTSGRSTRSARPGARSSPRWRTWLTTR